jgi:membrane protein YdbS with pleckstrin-like domain
MTTRDPLSFKKICLWSLLAAWFLLATYLAFIGSITVWVGLTHAHQAGFWLPVMTGVVLLALLFWVSLGITKIVLRHTKEEDLLEM